MVSAADGLTTHEKALVAVLLLASVTRTTKVLVPATVGVPDMSPVCDIETPGGSDPLSITHKYGSVPPEAIIDRLYGMFTVASGILESAIESRGVTEGVITAASDEYEEVPVVLNARTRYT